MGVEVGMEVEVEVVAVSSLHELSSNTRYTNTLPHTHTHTLTTDGNRLSATRRRFCRRRCRLISLIWLLSC